MRYICAKPYGQGWEQHEVDAGDPQCAENQLLHGQYIDNVAQARTTTFYDPAQHDRYNPATFVDKITVPVFLAGAWQDEETGGDFANLLSRFDPAIPTKFTAVNGMHADSLAPAIAARWAEFLDFYVARRIPHIPLLVRLAAPSVFKSVYGVSGIELPPDRFSSSSSYAAADRRQ